jgi:hypothetical protein
MYALAQLRWYEHTEGLDNKRMPKQTVTAKMEEARKRGSREKID